MSRTGKFWVRWMTRFLGIVVSFAGPLGLVKPNESAVEYYILAVLILIWAEVRR